MREIEFRAKHTWDSSFVYGYLGYKANDGKYIINPNGKEVNYFIDPETIGQYTGLTDKNGTKIFEGDIVRDFETNGNFQVVYEQRFCRFIGKRDLNAQWTKILLTANSSVRREVIGNIYDNPELIGGEDENK